MKNFEEESIPTDTPIVLETKASFELVNILNQIKKSSKIIKNVVSKNTILPKYFIGTLCSFKNFNVDVEMSQLNEPYNGIDGNPTLFQHINEIIENNGIKFVICVINGETIRGYNLGKGDYTDPQNQSLKRVELSLMNETMKIGLSQDQLNQINEEFSSIYESINLEKIIEITYNEKKGLEDINKKFEEEIHEKMKRLKEAKKNNYKKIMK